MLRALLLICSLSALNSHPRPLSTSLTAFNLNVQPPCYTTGLSLGHPRITSPADEVLCHHNRALLARLSFSRQRVSCYQQSQRFPRRTHGAAARRGTVQDAKPSAKKSASDEATLTPKEYLEALCQAHEMLPEQGLALQWVGAGRETLAEALAIQLHQTGMAPQGYDFTEGQGVLKGRFPAAAAQVRIDLVRHIAKNLHRFNSIKDPTDKSLAAAAQRYGVKVVSLEVSAAKTIHMKEWNPQEGVFPKAELIVCRKDNHFVAVTTSFEGTDIFNSATKEEILEQMQGSLEQVGLITESQITAKRFGAFKMARKPQKIVRANPMERRRILRQYVKEDAGVVLEPLELTEQQDFITAFVKALDVADIPVRATAVAGSAGMPLSLAPAIRMVRSEMIIYLAAHSDKYEDLDGAFKEMAALAYKYRVQIVCHQISGTMVLKDAFGPAEGVMPRATLHIGQDGKKFYGPTRETELEDPTASFYDQPASSIEDSEEGVSSVEGLDNIIEESVSIDEDEESDPSEVSEPGDSSKGLNGAKGVDGAAEGQTSSPEEAEDEEGEKQIVFDPKTLSWKVAKKGEVIDWSKDSTAEETVPETSNSDVKKSSFLPRFSKFADASQSAPAVPKASVPTVGSAKSGINTAMDAHINSENSPGMDKLENMLKDKGLRIDKSAEGGGNVYLTIAGLMHEADLQVQGLMFTMFGAEQTGALIGAMSRKARTDVKRYLDENIDEFDKPGQWLGDHDLTALARIYRIRIRHYMVIYDTDVKETVYEPKDDQEPRAELHICLDKKLFWPIRALKPKSTVLSPESDLEASEDLTRDPPRPRTALEKVWAQYGSDNPAEKGKEEALRNARLTPTVELKRKPPSADISKTVYLKPRGSHTATVIWLHGLEGNPDEWKAFAETLHLPWVKFVMPAADKIRLTVDNRKTVVGWFDVSPACYRMHANTLNALPSVVGRLHDKIDEDTDSVKRARALVRQLVADELASGIPPERIVLGGYSQGATIAVCEALKMDETVGGVAALSMWQLPSIMDTSASSTAKDSLKLFAGHGTADTVVQAEFAEHMFERCCSTWGINNAQFKTYPGLGHGLSMEEVLDLRKFLLSVIPGDSDKRLPPVYERRRASQSGAPATGKTWGDGSTVSMKSFNQLFQRGSNTQETKEFEEKQRQAIINNIEDFIGWWKDPSAKIWDVIYERRHTL